jgi:hypothetical protein
MSTSSNTARWHVAELLDITPASIAATRRRKSDAA